MENWDEIHKTSYKENFVTLNLKMSWLLAVKSFFKADTITS